MKKLVFILVLLAMLFPVASAVEAQDMTVRFYLIPIMVVDEIYRGPSYLKWRENPTGLAVPWACKDYGSINVMICAVNAEQTDHDWLAAQDDVYQFPADLDQTLTAGQVTAVQNWLEDHWIPGDWVDTSNTWRDVLRPVTQLFLYMQRVSVILGYDTDLQQADLDMTLSQIPAGIRAAMQQAAEELGYDLEPVKLSWTLRHFLKYMADQWGERDIYFGFVTL